MALFSLIILGWAFGIVALVYYVQNTTSVRQSRASDKSEVPKQTVTLTQTPIDTPTVDVTVVVSPGHSTFGQLLTPSP